MERINPIHVPWLKCNVFHPRNAGTAPIGTFFDKKSWKFIPSRPVSIRGRPDWKICIGLHKTNQYIRHNIKVLHGYRVIYGVEWGGDWRVIPNTRRDVVC